MPTYTTTDPVTGQVTYTYSTIDLGWTQPIASATDYDTANKHPWASYSLQYGIFSGTSYLRSAETLFDDGSSLTVEEVFYTALLGFPINTGERTVLHDSQGRVDFTSETFNGAPYRFPVPEVSRLLDWDVTTGRLDFALTTFRDGHVEAVDYDTVTGKPDYAITAYATGRVVADDYDPISGRIDYRVTTEPDGVVSATDYDLADEYGWDTYTVVLAADGSVIDSVFA